MRRSRRAGVTGAILTAALLLGGAVLPGGGPLLDAAKQGDVEAVRSLLRSGADPNEAQGDGMTALHLAGERGHLEVAEALLDAGADVEARTRLGGYTALHVASRAGRAEVVEALLEAGSDAGATTESSGVTALHLAAQAENGAAAVAALLEHGAPIDARDAASGQTALMFAAGFGRTEAVRELLAHGADPNVSTKVVDVLQRMAVDAEVARQFREAVGATAGAVGGDGRQQSGSGPRAEVPLAAVQDAVEEQREFLATKAAEIRYDPSAFTAERPDYPGGPPIPRPPYRETLVGKTGGMTALHHAAREGHMEAALALLDGGADIDQVSGDGTSPLLIATLNGQYDLALELIERGADPNLAATTDGVAPLFAVLQTTWAPKSNYPQPRAQDTQEAEHMEVLQALLDAGADPNVRLNSHLWYWEFGLTKIGIDLTGATPFYRAALAQDLEAMKALVAHGADPHIPTVWPAAGMRERRQQDGRQQEDSGIEPPAEGSPNAYPIHAAVAGGRIALGAFSINGVPNGFLPAVKYLIEEHGADPSQRDSWGYTPLHYAAATGNNAVIEYLASQGADVGAVTRLGQSTADMARGGMAGFFMRVAFPETEALLVSLGSPLLCKNTHFRDTGDYCAGSGAKPFEGAVVTTEGDAEK